VDAAFPPQLDLEVWTSTLARTVQTGEALGRQTLRWRNLDEIDAGTCEGMSYDEVRTRMPAEFEARVRDKLRYRYPRGESYEDVIRRIDPIILELERRRHPVLIIAHQAVHRVLYSYFMARPAAECPHVDIPLHTIIKLTPRAYGVEEERVPLPPWRGG
jgi:broad specificity phosphatase PhoE